MPSQNTGTDTRIDVLSVTSMSQNEYRFTAERIPATIPISASMMMATRASFSVFGNFSRGWWRPAASAGTTRPGHRGTDDRSNGTYWYVEGLSSPYSLTTWS